MNDSEEGKHTGNLKHKFKREFCHYMCTVIVISGWIRLSQHEKMTRIWSCGEQESVFFFLMRHYLWMTLRIIVC